MKFFRDAIVAVLAGVAALVGLEGLLRIAQVHYNASLYTDEFERGYAYRPNAKGWHTEDDGNDTYLRINSHGYHDKERPFERPAGIVRIAVLGSSEIAGAYLPVQYTFTSLLEKHLSESLAASGTKVEVINAAIDGYSLSQLYLTLKNCIWKFDPQIVVLAASAYSYVASTRDFRPEALPGVPFLELRDGVLQPDRLTRLRTPPDPRAVARHDRLADIMNSVTLLGLANWARVRLPAQIGAFRAFFRPVAGGVADPHVKLTYTPGDPAVRKNWDVTEAIILEMSRECRRRKVEFWTAVLPMPWQVDPQPSQRERFLRGIGVLSGNATAERLEAFAASHGIGFFDVTPPLARYAVEHNVTITEYSNEHPNELGQALAAAAAADALLTESKVLAHGGVPVEAGPNTQQAILRASRAVRFGH
jgi:hypothetical protein